MANDFGNQSMQGIGQGTGQGVGRAAVDAADGRSQFERIRDYLNSQFGAVREIEVEQQSAELLLELAEGELGDLKREFAAARLGAARR